MEKNLDQWHEIAGLINKDKKKALDDFHLHGFVPGDRPVRGTISLVSHRPVMRPMFMAVAASMLLVAGLIFFWILSANRHSVSTAPALGQLLADSFLYNIGSEPKEEAPGPCAVSSFSQALSAWGVAAGLNRTNTSTVEPVDPSATIEHGDPEKIRQKIGKVIRENAIERMLTQFCQICKEV
jgi:hypothetical protein